MTRKSTASSWLWSGNKYYIMIIFGKMLTYFQLKSNNNTFIESYIFNDKAPVISLWMQSSHAHDG